MPIVLFDVRRLAVGTFSVPGHVHATVMPGRSIQPIVSLRLGKVGPLTDKTTQL